MKVCTVCKAEKPFEAFSKNKGRKDGHHNACKKCKSESDKRSYEKNREKRIANMKRYYNENKDWFLDECKKYREQNKEKIAEYKKDWAKQNRGRKSLQEKAWRENNEEKNRQMKRRWYSKNRDRVYSNLLKRRSLKFNVRFRGVKRLDILNRDNWTCKECGVQVHDGNINDKLKAHIDHIIPISKGGDSTPENLQVLCRTCNLSKRDRTDLVIKNDGQMTFEI